MRSKDLWKGVFVGLVAPVVAFAVYILFYRDQSIDYFLNKYVSISNLPSIISLSLLINLLIFFMNIQTNRDSQAKGILMSTIIYGFLIVILKFV